MSLADQANDHGACWPSLAGLVTRTCFGRTAVIDAAKWLEASGFIVIEKADGRTNRYQIDLDRLRQASLEPVREADRSGRRTSPGGGLPPVREADQPVRQADPNRKEPSLEEKKETRKRVPPPTCPPDVSEQTWSDWLSLRKEKRAPVSETVINGARAEAAKAGLQLERFLAIWCLRGSQGLQAEWLKPHERGSPSAPTFAQRDAADKAERVRQMTGGLMGGQPKDLMTIDMEAPDAPLALR